MNFEEFKEKFQKVQVTETVNQVTDRPLLSVCITTFQHQRFIKQCLDGVLMQKTSFDFEILIGDDASTDGTREICLEYARRFPEKVRLFLHCRENNIAIGGTPTGRFNFVYSLFSCRGKYIALCEGDDYWTDPLKLERQVDFLEKNPDFSICYHRINEQHKFGRIEPETLNILEHSFGYSIVDLAEKNIIPALSVVFRNNFNASLQDWFLEFPVGDYALHMLNAKSGKIYYMPDIMAVYRRHDGGLWSKLDEKRRTGIWLLGLKMLINEFKNSPEVRNALKYQNAKFMWSLAKLYKDEGNYNEMKQYLNSAMGESPRFIEEWINTELIKSYMEIDAKLEKINSNILIRLARVIKNPTKIMKRILR